MYIGLVCNVWLLQAIFGSPPFILRWSIVRRHASNICYVVFPLNVINERSLCWFLCIFSDTAHSSSIWCLVSFAWLSESKCGYHAGAVIANLNLAFGLFCVQSCRESGPLHNVWLYIDGGAPMAPNQSGLEHESAWWYLGVVPLLSLFHCLVTTQFKILYHSSSSPFLCLQSPQQPYLSSAWFSGGGLILRQLFCRRVNEA